MKRVTRNNLLKLVNMMKEFEKTKDEELKNTINDFINNVINLDKHYYSKLKSYNLKNEILQYLM